MHPPALGEGLALDPAEDLTPLLVHAEPARRRVETGAFEVAEGLTRELGIGSSRPANRVADANDAVVRRAAGELRRD
jgi:hypothetical protein